MTPTKVIVLHVKTGYEERKQHICRMLGTRNIDFEFLLDGDMTDLTPEILDRYFTGEMKQVAPAVSCTMKHLLACELIVSRQLSGALILEDDMLLYKNFDRVFDECMNEMTRYGIDDALISFEDSALRFVPGSQRQRGRHLYLASKDRFAGCYYLTFRTAKKIMDYVNSNKCDLPVDLFHKALIVRAGLPYYWCHPCIATQGTHNGIFPSSICAESAKKQHYRAWTWQLKLAYKKLLYLLR